MTNMADRLPPVDEGQIGPARRCGRATDLRRDLNAGGLGDARAEGRVHSWGLRLRATSQDPIECPDSAACLSFCLPRLSHETRHSSLARFPVGDPSRLDRLSREPPVLPPSAPAALESFRRPRPGAEATEVHPATAFPANRWRLAGLTRARSRSSSTTRRFRWIPRWISVSQTAKGQHLSTCLARCEWASSF